MPTGASQASPWDNTPLSVPAMTPRRGAEPSDRAMSNREARGTSGQMVGRSEPDCEHVGRFTLVLRPRNAL